MPDRRGRRRGLASVVQSGYTSPTVSVEILYFAAVRDTVGRSDERVDLPREIRSVRALAAHLVALHPELDGRLDSVRIAVNEAFADQDDPVTDGDVIALIPPVAGG